MPWSTLEEGLRSEPWWEARKEEVVDRDKANIAEETASSKIKIRTKADRISAGNKISNSQGSSRLEIMYNKAVSQAVSQVVSKRGNVVKMDSSKMDREMPSAENAENLKTHQPLVTTAESVGSKVTELGSAGKEDDSPKQKGALVRTNAE